MRGVDSTPYLGDVAIVVHPGKKEMGTPLADTPTRPVTWHGGMRDLHESSFSLSGKGEGVVGASRQDKSPGSGPLYCYEHVLLETHRLKGPGQPGLLTSGWTGHRPQATILPVDVFVP